MKKEISNDGTWVIEFETDNGKFFLYKMDEGNKEEYGSYDSYENAQKARDRAETIRKRKIAPLPFIKKEMYEGDGYKKGKITSISEVRDYSVYVWTSVEKSRSKESFDLLKDTISNEDTLKKISQLKDDIKKEGKKLVRYTREEIIKHFGEAN